MASEQQRSLQIKLGTVKRLSKELVMYRDEVTKEQQKVQTLKDNNADPHDIKYAENILAESSAMVPDTAQRLKSAARDLQEFIDETHPDDSPDLSTAKDLLSSSTTLLDTV